MFGCSIVKNYCVQKFRRRILLLRLDALIESLKINPNKLPLSFSLLTEGGIAGLKVCPMYLLCASRKLIS